MGQGTSECPPGLQFQKQPVGPGFQRSRDANEDGQAGGTFAPLNPAHVVRMNLRPLGQGLLAQTGAFAVPEHCFTNDFAFRVRHRCLRKQNAPQVTTHAPCRIKFSPLHFRREGVHRSWINQQADHLLPITL